MTVQTTPPVASAAASRALLLCELRSVILDQGSADCPPSLGLRLNALATAGRALNEQRGERHSQMRRAACRLGDGPEHRTIEGRRIVWTMLDLAYGTAA